MLKFKGTEWKYICFKYFLRLYYIASLAFIKGNANKRTERTTKWFLEAKASKGMYQVCIEKSPDRHLSIHPR